MLLRTWLVSICGLSFVSSIFHGAIRLCYIIIFSILCLKSYILFLDQRFLPCYRVPETNWNWWWAKNASFLWQAHGPRSICWISWRWMEGTNTFLWFMTKWKHSWLMMIIDNDFVLAVLQRYFLMDANISTFIYSTPEVLFQKKMTR